MRRQILLQKKKSSRGRKEVSYQKNPMLFLEKELEATKGLTSIAINVRASSLEPYVQAADLAKKFGAILEINAHCRQPEMIELDAGEALLKDANRLCYYIRELKRQGLCFRLKREQMW